MKRAISILMVIILFTGCSPVFAESKMAIGKDTATTAKENAYTFAYVYLLDPDGFSTDMTDLLYHYTMMYILALATDTAEVKFAAGDGNVSKAEGIDYSRSKAYSSVIENGIEKYKDWLDGKVSSKEFAEYLCSVLDSVTVTGLKTEEKTESNQGELPAAFSADPIKVSMELSKYSFSGPETVTVSITVTNIGDKDMLSPVSLYYPNGKKVAEFGSPILSVGSSKSWSGEWTVTREQLDAGKVGFKVSYSYYEDTGDDKAEPKLVKKGKNFSKKITFTGANP